MREETRSADVTDVEADITAEHALNDPKSLMAGFDAIEAGLFNDTDTPSSDDHYRGQLASAAADIPALRILQGATN